MRATPSPFTAAVLGLLALLLPLLPVVCADNFTIPAQGIIGQCSAGTVVQLGFNATASPGITAIYTVNQTQYAVLQAAPPTADAVAFKYIPGLTCLSAPNAPVTTCSRSTPAGSGIAEDVYCVVFVNQAAAPAQGSLDVQFFSPKNPGKGGGGGGASGKSAGGRLEPAGVGVVVVAAVLTAAMWAV